MSITGTGPGFVVGGFLAVTLLREGGLLLELDRTLGTSSLHSSETGAVYRDDLGTSLTFNDHVCHEEDLNQVCSGSLTSSCSTADQPEDNHSDILIFQWFRPGRNQHWSRSPALTWSWSSALWRPLIRELKDRSRSLWETGYRNEHQERCGQLIDS